MDNSLRFWVTIKEIVTLNTYIHWKGVWSHVDDANTIYTIIHIYYCKQTKDKENFVIT